MQDLDDSPASRNFIDAFRASITFHVVAWPIDQAAAAGASLQRRARRAHHSARTSAATSRAASIATVQILVDASDANTAKLIQGYAGQIARGLQPANTRAPPSPQPVRADIRLWFNPGRSSKKFYGPGIFVLGISMFPPLLAALAMAKEGEQKTILQVYVSNISAHEFLLGKIFAFMAVALGRMALVIARFSSPTSA